MEISLGQVWGIRKQWHGIRSSGCPFELCQHLGQQVVTNDLM